MIRLTRLNGSEFSLNPDLIHRAEETPDTVLTLIDGSRYVVVESLDEIVDRVVGYRARVIAEAGRIATVVHDLPGPLEDTVVSGVHFDGRAHADYDRDYPEDRDDPDDHEGADVVRLRSRRA